MQHGTTTAPRIVVVIGSPGSGKGTICQGIVAENPSRYIHISTGDICREEVERKTALGQRLATYLPNNMVPDRIIIDVIREKLNERDVEGKIVLLDGFPRTRNQALQLTQSFTIERLVFLQASDDVCLTRITERRVDPLTHKVYNLRSVKPPRDIESRLIQRPMDQNEQTIKGRLTRFHASVPAIMHVFKGRIFAVNSAQTVSQVINAVADVLAIPIQVAPPVASGTTVAAAPKPKVIVKDKKGVCVICRVQPADYLLTPCGHQCGCGECLQQLMQQANRNNCPICRTAIQGIVQVFQSGFIDSDEEDSSPQGDDTAEVPADIIMPDLSGWGANPDAAAAVLVDPQAPTSVVSVAVAPCETSSDRMAVTINVPDAIPIIPVDVCCIIDVSGSMGMEATFQDPSNESKTIGSGMTQLDLVKHAVKTIINTLTDRDSLSITAFHTDAREALGPTLMSDNGKQVAVSALEALETLNRTNIWDGLETGLDSLRTSQQLSSGPRHKFCFFLTDGMPNDSPPDGEVKCLQKYKENHPDFKFMLSTFGFGYELQSKLMLDLAREGGGTFGFIPDAKILGTCFVNAVAHARACMCLDSKLHLTPKNGCRLAASQPFVDATIEWRKVSWGTVAHLGPIHSGQSRDIVVQLENLDQATVPEFLDVTLEFSHPEGETVKIRGTGLKSSSPTSASYAANARCIVCMTLYEVIEKLDKKDITSAHKQYLVLKGQITGIELLSHDPKIQALMQDIEGRIAKAMSTQERFNRWGGHYLRALFRSHQLQMKTNFMDPGLQVYGGQQFNSLVEMGGKIFVTLPMEKSIKPGATKRALRQAQQQQQQPRRGAAAAARQTPTPPPSPPPTYAEDLYAGEGGGCFAGECLVETANESKTKFIQDVQRGDRLLMADGTFLKVTLVVELRHRRTDLIKLDPSGLTITPNHPIRQNDKWVRPKDQGATGSKMMKVEANSVFNFLFEERPDCGLRVNGVECVTYHHRIPEMQHKFYTTDAIIDTLRGKPGFDQGRVCIEGTSLKKKGASVIHI